MCICIHSVWISGSASPNSLEGLYQFTMFMDCKNQFLRATTSMQVLFYISNLILSNKLFLYMSVFVVLIFTLSLFYGLKK